MRTRILNRRQMKALAKSLFNGDEIGGTPIE